MASPATGQRNPLPIKRGQYLERSERSELTKRGAFSIPRSRQSPANGLSLASPSVTSYGRCASIWLTPYVQPPSYRTVVQTRKPSRPGANVASCTIAGMWRKKAAGNATLDA